MRLLREKHPVKMETHPAPGEAAAALALVGEEVGVVVLAGTGAFVRGRTRDGRELHLDGLGPMLGDYGGGYQIGSLAVRAVAKSRWHPRHQTSLTAPIHRACGVNDGEAPEPTLIRFMHAPRDRAEIASFAELVNEEAEAGDRIAREILEQAATAISETLRDLVDRLGIAQEEYAMVGTGGVATGSRIYWQHLCALAREFAPGLKPVISELPAVVGLVLPTLQSLATVGPKALQDNLSRSMREMVSKTGR
jgi:N-acetylglucosamine kinase